MIPAAISAGSTIEKAPCRNVDADQQRHDHEDIGLEHRQQHAGEELAQQQIPARQRRRQQQAHHPHLAVIDHRQRRLHALEQQHDAHQARHHVDLIRHIGFVGRRDRNAEHVLEPGADHDQPQRRPHHGRGEPPGLIDEARQFAPRDGGKGFGGVSGVHATSPPPDLRAIPSPERNSFCMVAKEAAPRTRCVTGYGGNHGPCASALAVGAFANSDHRLLIRACFVALNRRRSDLTLVLAGR